jgi:hypothetical protein
MEQEQAKPLKSINDSSIFMCVKFGPTGVTPGDHITPVDHNTALHRFIFEMTTNARSEMVSK